MHRYFYNDRLFAGDYFERVLNELKFPSPRVLPENWKEKLQELLSYWEDSRKHHMVYKADAKKSYVGLPEGWIPLEGSSESNIEQGFIRKVLESIFGYSIDNNRTLKLQGDAASEVVNKNANQRPDMILFPSIETLNSAANHLDKTDNNAVTFCHDALFILDAKKFSKGVGADEKIEDISKIEKGAYQDIQQVDRYLRGCNKKWGILTNGRSWRLMRTGDGETLENLKFDLVLFLEDLRNEKSDLSIEDPKTKNIFSLFWYMFGIPAVSGGYLDKLDVESQANNKKVRDILKDNAHKAVELIAKGFFHHPSNPYANDSIQTDIDHLRELSLTFLYRLLFILKAEALNLLPTKDEKGGNTLYYREYSTRAIFEALNEKSHSDREGSSRVFKRLKDLFQSISRGGEAGIPAYNGGLFNEVRNEELESLLLYDKYLYEILHSLIYLDDEEPVPYEDLEVRDLGDIYEGLLEQRLVLKFDPNIDCNTVVLYNQKGERKASGSYFTPDRLVDHLVRKTLLPLLDGCNNDPHKILNLKVLDPSMGSGHFLVKAVDVMAAYLTVNCDPVDEGAPDENGAEELAYWKSKIAEHCIYGVDFNPMAVELAKVSLWLHTARKDKPLSFLDHHLKCGNSLVGARLEDLTAPGMKSKVSKNGNVWEPVAEKKIETLEIKKRKKDKKQLAFAFPIDTSLFSGILESIHTILDAPSDTASDIHKKNQKYADIVAYKLKAHKALADLWCAQWFKVAPNTEGIKDYETQSGIYTLLKDACGLPYDNQRFDKYEELLAQSDLLQAIEADKKKGYGARQFAYFHWQLEFPEVAFDAKGTLKKGFGFDVVVGNPPWDKIKPAKKDFYSPFSEAVASSQAGTMDKLIMQLENENPALVQGWIEYEKDLKDFTEYLSAKNEYEWQTVKVNGKKTGGDPDLFRYFIERAFQCVEDQGRVGFLVPGGLWQSEGCTGLRQLILGENTIEQMEVFENYRKWAFNIHTSFKFTSFVAEKKKPRKNGVFYGAFMLRDTRYLDGLLPEREVKLSQKAIENLSPDTLALLDIKSDGDFQLINRLHEEFPAFGDEKSGWNAKYRRELDMTNDSWLFKKTDWMTLREFTEVFPVDKGETWHQAFDETQKPYSAKLPDPLPRIGNYWIAADAEHYRSLGYKEISFEPKKGNGITAFISNEDIAIVNKPNSRFEEKHFRIIPNGIYTPLYEGRMVHNFDHCQKKYIGGEGRTAIWDDFEAGDRKVLQAHFYVCQQEISQSPTYRIGFCDVTGATNERSMLATIIPNKSMGGNKVPTLSPSDLNKPYELAAVLSSFVYDYLIRLRITTTMNYVYVKQIPTPFIVDSELKNKLLQLCCTTPELAELWEEEMGTPWSYSVSPKDLWERAALRAEIDAIVADMYGLSVEEYARVLTSFPIMDRKFNALDGDYFLTESDHTIKDNKKKVEGVHWIENSAGVFEMKPRSFITRDFALFTYMKRKKYQIPSDLEEWYKTKVKLDTKATLSKFRIGKEKNLSNRIGRAKDLGAIAYVPS
jgi:Eco57I restriction-modification methylase